MTGGVVNRYFKMPCGAGQRAAVSQIVVGPIVPR